MRARDAAGGCVDTSWPVRTRILLLALLAALTAASCGGDDGTHSYLGEPRNGVIYVTWNRAGDDVTGGLTQALLDATTNAVTTKRVSFTGKVTDSGVALQLAQGFGASTTLTGTLDGDKLVLQYPGQADNVIRIPFKKASAEDFNTALAALRQQGAGAIADQERELDDRNARQNAEMHAKAVPHALKQLAEAEAALRRHGYRNDLQQLRTDLAAVRRDTQTALAADSSSVCSDAGTVDSGVGTIQSTIGTLEANQSTGLSNITLVKEAIASVRDTFAQLQGDDPANLPAGLPTKDDVDTALRSARGRIKVARAASSNATTRAKKTLQAGERLLAQANAACERAGG